MSATIVRARLPTIGDKVDRYTVVADVAQGGMAAVFAVKRSTIGGLEKLLAMKVLLPTLANDRRFLDMFLDEARIAMQLQHPNIVQVFDVGEHEGLPFIVMEFLKGQPFFALLKRATPDAQVPLGLIYDVLEQTASGLHGAHEARGHDNMPLGVVHRDVSPQNVHVGYDGHVKVVDFGIAAAVGRITSTRTGEIKGKLGYLAPEQIERTSIITRQTDVWALGVLAWEGLVGKRLFRAGSDAETMWAIMNSEIQAPRKLVPGISRELSDLVLACLSRDPQLRPADAAVVAQAFERARADADWSTAKTAEFVSQTFAAERNDSTQRISTAMRDVEREEARKASLAPNAPSNFIRVAIIAVLALGLLAAVIAVARMRERESLADRQLNIAPTAVVPPPPLPSREPPPIPVPPSPVATEPAPPDAGLTVSVVPSRRRDAGARAPSKNQAVVQAVQDAGTRPRDLIGSPYLRTPPSPPGNPTSP